MTHSFQVAFLSILLTTAACGFPTTAALPPPRLSPGATSNAGQRWPSATPEALAAGRQSFVAKCNGCHGYPSLTSVSEARWPSIMLKMGKKSDLSAQQRDDVLHFILSARSDVASAP